MPAIHDCAVAAWVPGAVGRPPPILYHRYSRGTATMPPEMAAASAMEAASSAGAVEALASTWSWRGDRVGTLASSMSVRWPLDTTYTLRKHSQRQGTASKGKQTEGGASVQQFSSRRRCQAAKRVLHFTATPSCPGIIQQVTPMVPYVRPHGAVHPICPMATLRLVLMMQKTASTG